MHALLLVGVTLLAAGPKAKGPVELTVTASLGKDTVTSAAVAVTPRRVAVAYSAVRHASAITVQSGGGKPSPATLLAVDRERDLAVLGVESDFPVTPLRAGLASGGEAVTGALTGTAQGGTPNPHGPLVVLATRAPPVSGPVYDGKGQVVAFVSTRSEVVRGKVLGTPAQDVEALLKDVCNDAEVAHRWAQRGAEPKVALSREEADRCARLRRNVGAVKLPVLEARRSVSGIYLSYSRDCAPEVGPGVSVLTDAEKATQEQAEWLEVDARTAAITAQVPKSCGPGVMLEVYAGLSATPALQVAVAPGNSRQVFVEHLRAQK